MCNVPVDYKRSLFVLVRRAKRARHAKLMTTRVPVVNGATARSTVLAGKTARVDLNTENLLH